MARITWLADVLRAAGLPVVEVSGWRTRGSDNFNPRGLIAHATAGSRTATDQGELNVILNGSSSAPPPISQLMLGRTGVWYVVASGRCNHARVGTAGRLKGLGNTNLLGVEGCNDNRGEPWNSYGSYVRGVAAICRHAGWNPQSLISGHKEHQPGEKTDPTFDMNRFRSDVASASPTPQEEDMPLVFFAKLADDDTVYLVDNFMTNRRVTAAGFPVAKSALASNNLGTTVWEWPNDPGYKELLGVNLDRLDDEPEPLLATLTAEQLAELGLKIREGVPTLDQIRSVVDEESVSAEELAAVADEA